MVWDPNSTIASILRDFGATHNERQDGTNQVVVSGKTLTVREIFDLADHGPDYPMPERAACMVCGHIRRVKTWNPQGACAVCVYCAGTVHPNVFGSCDERCSCGTKPCPHWTHKAEDCPEDEKDGGA